jgi:hypothetical protein
VFWKLRSRREKLGAKTKTQNSRGESGDAQDERYDENTKDMEVFSTEATGTWAKARLNVTTMTLGRNDDTEALEKAEERQRRRERNLVSLSCKIKKNVTKTHGRCE